MIEILDCEYTEGASVTIPAKNYLWMVRKIKEQKDLVDALLVEREKLIEKLGGKLWKD